MASRWLYRCAGGTPYAWTTDDKWFWLVDGGSCWTWRQREWFYDATTGQPIGWLHKDTLYDQRTGRPLYYFA
ncbi:hypothetical protein [Haloechinothrix salitolerans]|uniref:Cell wall binding repeat-containing protein n=1 Tax=Haloechinothrix salitolerans TaxID=926830 RepID=A0ABW2BZ08_9PSEU